MSTNFNELSTTAPVPSKDEVDNKIDKLSGIATIGNLLKIADNGGVEDSGKSLDDISLEMQEQLSDKLDSAAAGVAEFSDSVTYAVGVFVSRLGRIYKCTAAHDKAAWDSAHFAEVSLLFNHDSRRNNLAVGVNAKTNGQWNSRSVAIGPDATSNNERSVALGDSAACSANYATAIGYNAKVAKNADNAVQLGAGENKSPNSLQFRDIVIVDGDGKIKSSNLDVDIKQMTTLTPVYTGSWVFSDGMTHTIEPIRRENAFGGWEYSYYIPDTPGGIRYDPQTWFNTEEERDGAAEFTWDIYEFDGTGEVKTGTLTATRTLGYQLGDQDTKPLQPAGRYIKFPDYSDMTKHKYLYANDGGCSSEIQDFNKGGDHTWTPGRKCIVYTRIHNDTGSTRHVYIYVNQKDNNHIVLDTWLSNNIGETFPIMLDSIDSLILSFPGDSSVYKYAVNLSVYFID